jgi:cytochrome c-type biogenesis protein CcmH/NrfF
MRGEVTGMVAQGMSDQEIIAHYKAIYGEQILIVPDGRTGTILFAVPLVVFLLALGILLLVLRRMLRASGRSAGQAASPKVNPSTGVLLERVRREAGDPGLNL